MCVHRQRDPFKNYDAWKTRTPWDNIPDHEKACPAGEDGPELYSECGGLGQCECYPRTLWGFVTWWWVVLKDGEDVCTVVEDPECICPSKEEIRAEKEEARKDVY